ncbi:MAG: hypothetical protein IPJ74_25210 [Saprospiraceae bacterium]|nr:hypothetical protein [Saprospiraceae bacterium]
MIVVACWRLIYLAVTSSIHLRKTLYFDFEKFEQHAQLALRMMDDIVDMEMEKIGMILAKVDEDPEEEKYPSQRALVMARTPQKCLEGRRTGVGVPRAYVICWRLWGLQHGSEEGTDFAVKVHKTLVVNAYRASVNLAKERVAFEIYDASRE